MVKNKNVEGQIKQSTILNNVIVNESFDSLIELSDMFMDYISFLDLHSFRAKEFVGSQLQFSGSLPFQHQML